MENYVVSARKYRPTTFDSVVGQQSITNTLKNAIKTNHLAQAFLFCGSRGVGKTTCARILAKTINCFNRTEKVEACNECDSCKAFNEGASLNIYELDAASNNSVDDIRSLTDQVRFAPQIGTHKIYIIDEVHMLSKSAFNAFLKTLEEPPAHAIFILATTEKHKIIPTILSRCQIFDFNRIGVEDIADHLSMIAGKENIQAEEEALHLIAQKADGALRDSLSIFDQLVSFAGTELTYKAVLDNLNILDYDYYFKCTDLILKNNIAGSLLLFNEILQNGFDGHHFINGLASHLRNLLVCQDSQTLSLLEVGKSIKGQYQEQAQQCEVKFLLQGLEICRQCDTQYKGSKNQRLLVELSLMQLASITDPEFKQAEKKKPRIKSPEEIKQQNPTNELENSIAPTDRTTSPPKAQKTETKKTEPKPTPSQLTTPVTKVEEEQEPVYKPKQTKEDSKLKQKPKLGQLGNRAAKTSSLSISNLTNQEKQKENEKQDEAFTSDLREKYDEATFKATWKDLAEKINQEGDDGSSIVYAAMSTHEPILKDNFKIELKVDNKSQWEEMGLKRTDLHDFLRKKLRNGAIELEVTILKDKKQKKAYTPEEKFNKLAEKNPSLLRLKRELDLDFF